MYPPVSRQVLIGVVVTLVVFGVVILSSARGRARRDAAPVATFRSGEASTSGGEVLVDIAGAVRRPGVYELPRTARVLDAVRRAGGATSRANLAAINRAAPLVDGQQIVVPERSVGEAAGNVSPSSSTASASTPMSPVSINSADVAALDALPGIGPVTASKIVADRAAHGPFRRIDDLDRVSGIGPATIERIRSSLTL